MSLKDIFNLTLVFVLLSIAGVKAASIGNSDIQCQLPPTWREVALPKGESAAMPLFKDGRVFAIVAEDDSFCPIPRPIEEETSYERGYWASFAKKLAARGRFELAINSYIMVGTTPFRVFEGTRQTVSGLIYCRVAVTPANGKCYALMEIKRNAKPETDAGLQQIFSSFTWLRPPQIAWYQPLLHYSDEIAGLPLLLIAVGLGIYLIFRWSNPAVELKRQMNVCIWAMILCMINGQFIAGVQSAVGIVSMLLGGAYVLVLVRLQKKVKLAGQGVQMSPIIRKRLRWRFYLLIGAIIVGVAFADIQLTQSGEPHGVIFVVNLGTALMFGLILWFARKRFFPPE